MSASGRTELRRLDRRPTTGADDAVLACAIVRNEARRIGPLLDHHRALGVDRFLVVDHGSTDGTTETLLAEPDVHLWQTETDFRGAEFGARLFQQILDEHGRGRWVVVVDADELLVFPGSEERTLGDLRDRLTREGARAYSAVLLDLYADTSIAATILPADRTPLEVLRWFDRRWCHHELAGGGPFATQVGVFGGVRRRLFGGDVWEYCLSKVPFLHFDTDTRLVGGQHWTNLPLSAERGAVLHCKLVAGLDAFAWDELARGQRPPDDEYHRYAEALALDPDLSAFSPTESVRYTGTAQLVDLGIMGPVPDPATRAARAAALTAHAVDRLRSGDTDRAVGLLGRAAEVEPTATAPLLRLADVHADRGDPGAAAAALLEACERSPDDLGLLARAVDGPPLPPDWDPTTLPADPAGPAIVPSVDATVGSGAARLPEVPWVGFVHGTVWAPEHLPPYRERALEVLVDRPPFRAALAACRGLLTFTDRAARFLRAHTGVPVAVVPPPVVSRPAAFDPDRFAASPTVVQPGWWMTRLATVCDLPGDGIRKVRCVDGRFARVATGLARAQRRHEGWATDPVPLRATTDLGGVPATVLDAVLTDAVVIADLLDANADPVVLACLARGLPVIVPDLPGLVEALGPEYPLHVTDRREIPERLADLGRVRAAHEHLLERRTGLAPARFAEAVAAVWDGAR